MCNCVCTGSWHRKRSPSLTAYVTWRFRGQWAKYFEDETGQLLPDEDEEEYEDCLRGLEVFRYQLAKNGRAEDLEKNILALAWHLIQEKYENERADQKRKRKRTKENVPTFRMIQRSGWRKGF